MSNRTLTRLLDIQDLGANYAKWLPGQDFTFVVSVGSTLKTVSSFDPYLACKQFVIGYDSICAIPQLKERLAAFTEKEFTKMGRLQEALNSASQLPPFVRATLLADLGTVFCITSIRERIDTYNGRNTPQWAIDIQVDDEAAEAIGLPNNEGTVTLGKTPGRDRLFKKLLEEPLPVHCCSFEHSLTSNFIDFAPASGPCPCGYVGEDEDEEEAQPGALVGDTLDTKDPFLPEYPALDEKPLPRYTEDVLIQRKPKK